MLSEQEIYERVSAHLLTQRTVSEDNNGTCRLRSKDGRRCAIGSLISDEVYRPNIEGIGISYYQHASDGALLQMFYASNVNAYDQEIMALLIELEAVHDDAGVTEWQTLLLDIGHWTSARIRLGGSASRPNSAR
jgi:hypothetical protein